MSVDLIVQSGTKFALHQWLDARGLGDNVQDTDATSPTFGEYTYTHTAPGSFHYWNHPSGKVPKTYDATDPENVTTTDYAGFFARLSFPAFEDMPQSLTDWVANSTAVAVLGPPLVHRTPPCTLRYETKEARNEVAHAGYTYHQSQLRNQRSVHQPQPADGNHR